jgi:hypothetical protein
MISSAFGFVANVLRLLVQHFGTPCQFHYLGGSDQRENWEGVGVEHFIENYVGGD